MRFTVIGIPDNREFEFSRESKSLISEAKVFSGGRRHLQLVERHLPSDYEWINITPPLDGVFEEYKKHDDIVVFASGDPLFFGFANTIKRDMPAAEIKLIPYFNSLQLLAHSLLLPYHDMVCVSLTGRSWHEFDKVLIEGKEKVGLLTDKKKTPGVIASRMIEYGYTNYRILVGENMGGENQKTGEYSLDEVADGSFADLNCMILLRQKQRRKFFGIPEEEFKGLEGRPRMITKMPVRLLSLSMLDLYSKTVFWDVGFCTGSISIEARMQFPDLKIFAFEKRPEGENLMSENSRSLGCPGIKTITGDFFEQDLSIYDAPDCVFIGGHGGRLVDMMGIIASNIQEGGRLVFNSVSEKSKEDFYTGAGKHGFKVVKQTRIVLDDNNPIEIMVADKL